MRRALRNNSLPPGEGDENGEVEARRDSPGPVHRGGLALSLYSNSLSSVLFALFLITFGLHAVTGLQQHNEEALLHGQPSATIGELLGSPTFWFAALIVLSIFLRQKGSPESKPVHAPHAQTGAS